MGHWEIATVSISGGHAEAEGQRGRGGEGQRGRGAEGQAGLDLHVELRRVKTHSTQL